MKYLISVNPLGGQTIFDTEKSCWIPQDELNSDYQTYLLWLAEGNTPKEWTAE